MNNNVLLSLAISILPVLAIAFVALIVMYKIYIKIRSRFNCTVNCWFCNENTKVPYLESNCWTCPFCEQYNGFTKDGNYNREIYEQLDCSRTTQLSNHVKYAVNDAGATPAISNGFCDACNEAQRLKVEKLSIFEPKNEARFSDELNAYKNKLEEQYGLCRTCERHLNRVLREKRKMVLGSKFLDYLIKGGEHSKEPHRRQLDFAKQQKWKQRCRLVIALLSLINIICLYDSLPTLTKDHITNVVGNDCGNYVFIIASHALALVRVLHSYWQAFCRHEFIVKFGLFGRTLFLMVMYSMGLRITHLNMSSLFSSAYPFSILALTFVHQFMDGFRLSCCTFLMTVWSIFAGSLLHFTQQYNISSAVIMWFMSLLTLIFMYIAKPEPSPKSNDNIYNSFHKLYSEDFLSDDESISMLSQTIKGNSPSTCKTPAFRTPSPFQNIRQRAPLRTSTFDKWRSSAALGFANQQEKVSLPGATYGYNGNTERHNFSSFSTLLPQTSSPSPNVFSGAVLNSTSAEPSLRHTQMNNSFLTAASNSTLFGDNTRCASFETITTPLQSPFSLSTQSIYNETNAGHRNLLSPTRFSTNNLTVKSPPNISWLSGGYFNQSQNIFMPPSQTIINNNINGENLSRASSRSSGFESQNEPVTASRENSSCRDTNDIQQRTLTGDNITNHSFQPIGSSKSCSAFFTKPSVMKNSALNIHSGDYTAGNKLWEASMFAEDRQTFPTKFNRNGDIFNLRQINDQLLTINSSDLQRKSNDFQKGL